MTEEIKTNLQEAILENEEAKKEAAEIIENNKEEVDAIVKNRVKVATFADEIIAKMRPPHIKGEGKAKKLARRKKQKEARKQRKINRNVKSKKR